MKVRRLFACVLLLAVVGTVTSKAQPSSPADLAQVRARADQSDPEAQNALGNVYTNGLLGVKQDYAEALAWYRKAAEKGFAPAQFNLGLVYEMGRGVPADERQAFKHYLMAAEQGFGAAQFNIGNMYSTGRGVGQDLFEANLWYKQAAEKGIVEAQFNLGLGYEAGRGVKKDEAQAARWYKLASDRGFPRAQYNLGLLYEDGRGVPKNEATAASYYRAAADQGFAPAQNNYGVMLSEGRGGLAKNPVEAFVWLSLAAESGSNPAARDFVSRSLSAEQLVVANRALADRKAGRGTSAASMAVATPAAATPTSSMESQAPVVVSPVVSASTARIADLTEALDRARQANTQYSEANQRLEVEKAQLSQQLSQPTESGKLIEQLRDQSRRLAGQVESLTIEKDIAQREISVLNAQVKDAQQAATRSMPAAGAGDSSKLQSDISALTTQLAQANAELTKQRQTNQQLTQANATLQREKATPAASPMNRTPVSGTVVDSGRYPLQDAEKDSIIAGLQRDIVRLNDEVKRSGRELTAVNLQLRSLRNQGAAATSTPAEDMQLAAKADEATKEAARLTGENTRLTARIAELEKQPKPAPIDATLAPRLAATQQELKTVSDKLTEETLNFTQARARVSELEKQLTSAQQQASSGSGEVQELRKQLAAATQTREQSASVLASAQQENQRLVTRIADLEKQPKPAAVDPTLAPRLAQAQQDLKATADKLAAENTNFTRAQSRVAELEKQLAATQQQASSGSGEVQELRKQLAAATQTREQTAATLATAQQENKRLAARIADFEKQPKAPVIDPTVATRLAQAQTELKSLNEKLSTGSATLAQSQARVTELEKQLAVAQQQASAGNSGVEDLRKQLVSANQTLAQSTARITDLTKINKRLQTEADSARQSGERAANEARQQLASVQQELTAAREGAAGLVTAREENQKLSARIADLEKQPKPTVDPTLAPRLAKAEQTATQLEEQLKVLHSEKSDLEKWAQTLEKNQEEKTALAAAAAAEATELKQKLEDAEKRFNNASKLVADQKEAVKKLAEENKTLAEKAAAEVGPSRAAINDLNNARQQLAAEKERSDRWMKSSQSMTEKAAEQAVVVRKAQTSLTEIKAQLDATEKKLADSSETIKTLNSELASAKQYAARSKADAEEIAKLRAATETLATLRQENSRLTARVTELENQPKLVVDESLAPRLTQAQTRVAQLEKDLTAAREESSNTNASIEELRKQLEESSQTLERTTASFAGLTNANKQLENELTQLKSGGEKAATAASAQLNDLRQQLAAAGTAAADAAKLRDENKRLATQVTQLENQPKPKVDETLAPRLAQSQQRIAALEAELRTAQQQSTTNTAQVGDLQKQLVAAKQVSEKASSDLARITSATETANRDFEATKLQLSEAQKELYTAKQTAASAAVLRSENTRLASRIAELETQVKAATAEQSVAPKLAEAQAKIASLEKDLRAAQQQASGGATNLNELKQKLASVTENFDQSTKAVAGLQSELAAAKQSAADAAALRSELNTLRAAAGDVAGLRDENARLAARVLDLQSAPKPAGDDSLAEKLAQAQQQIRTESDKAAAARSSYIQSQARIASLEADLRIEQRKSSGSTSGFEDLKKQLDEANASLEKSKADVVALQANLTAAQQSAAEIGAIKTENARLVSRVNELQNQPKPLVDETLAPRLEQAQAKVTALEAELRSSQKTVADNSTTVESLRKQLADAKQAETAATSLRAENARLTGQLTEFQKRPVADQTLAPRLQQAEAKAAALENELRAAQKTVSEGATTLDGLRKQLAEAKQAEAAANTLRTENARLSTRVADLEKRPVADETLAPRLEQAQAKVTALESQLATAQKNSTNGSAVLSDLQKQLVEAKQVATAAADLRTQNAQLTSRVADLEKRPAADLTLAPKLTQAQAQVTTLTERVATLEKDLRAAQQTSTGSETEISDLKKQLAATMQSLQTSKANVAELTELNKQLETEALTVKSATERDLAQSRESVADLQRQLTEAKQGSEQLASLRDEVTKLRASSADLVTLRTENTRLTARVTELQNQPKPAGDNTLAPRLAQAQTRISTLEAELQKTRQEVASFSDIKEQLDEANQALEKSGASVAELTALNERLEKDVAAARQTAQRETATLKTQVADLQKQLTTSKQALTDSTALRDEVTKLRADAAGLATLRTENDRLRTAAAEATSLRTKLDQLTRDNEQLTSFMNGNRRDLDAAQARVAALEKQIADAKATGGRSADDMKKLQNQLTEANQAAEKLNITVGELTAENDRLEKDLDSAKKSVNAALAAQAQAMSATQPDAYKMEISTLSARVKELEGQLEDDRGNTAKEFASLASQLQRARETNRSLSEANRSLMSAKQSEIPTVNKDEFDQLQSRMRDTVAGSEELRRINQKLTEDNQRITSDLATMRQQLEDARKVTTLLPGLADEKAALQERLEAVGAQLAKSQQEIDTLQKDNGSAAAQLLASQQATQRALADLATLRSRASDAEKAAESHNTSVAELTDINVKLEAERDDLRRQVASAKAESARLTQAANSTEQLKADADRSAQQNIDTLSAQLVQARRELQSARDINSRIAETSATQERDRSAVLTQLRQENAALVSRLTQAQGTLDQIASAARLATPAAVLASGGTLPTVTPPTQQTAQAAARYHTVTEGDSLSRISLRYYGTANRWQEIFQANRDVLQGSSTLRVGMQLRIP